MGSKGLRCLEEDGETIYRVRLKVRTTLPAESVKYLKSVEQTLHVGIKPYKDYARFKLDECVDVRLTKLFEAEGHDAETVFSEDVAGIDDSGIYDLCRREKRYPDMACITLNAGLPGDPGAGRNRPTEIPLGLSRAQQPDIAWKTEA